MESSLELNKRTAMAFMKMAFVDGNPEEAIRLYVGEQYRQHNPNVPDGKEAVLAYAKQRSGDNRGRTMNFVRLIAEGDYVVLHIEHIFAKTDKAYADAPQGLASVDIFRFENGKIVEHWDVLQAVPAVAAHNNTMF